MTEEAQEELEHVEGERIIPCLVEPTRSSRVAAAP